MPQSPDNVSCLFSMIENDILQNLGRPKKCFFFLWSSMNCCESLECWTFLDSMIVNDLLQSLGCPKMCLISLHMIVNDRLWSVGCPKMFFIWSLWSSLFHPKPRVQKNESYLKIMMINDLLYSPGRPIYVLFNPSLSKFFFFRIFSGLILS